ncbi:MAG: histidinol-phosphatase [Rhodospirillaceae bacterium]|nr:histidinol-phosphatase [Rhodospirillaceae bacterium]
MEDHAENLGELSFFALRLADLSGSIAMQYFRKTLEIEHKDDLSPVTVADRQIEAAMRERIEEKFPSHGIFGEEHGKQNLDADKLWVLDPIDGTKSFISGMPTFGTLVAYLENGVPKIGVVDIPATDERWLGVSGQPTLFNGRECNVSSCRNLSDSVIYATSPDIFDGPGRDAFERVSARAAMRRFGGDCYTYGLLASGHVDAVMEMSLEPYDYLALVAVIEGAGGTITDWQGKPLTEKSDGRVIAAATKELHSEIISLL